MSLSFTGKFNNASNLASLTNRLKDPTHVYMGFATVTIGDTDDLSTITESTAIARFEVTSSLGTSALDGGVPKLKNSSDITSGNATIGGQAIVSWFLTTVAAASVGEIICYGDIDSGAAYTNVGFPFKALTGSLTTSID